MRKRLQRAVIVAVVAALAVFVLPLGLAGSAFISSQARQNLERTALEAAFRVGPTFTAGDPVELPQDRTSAIGLYSPAGRRVSGSGPLRLEQGAVGAQAGMIVQTQVGGVMIAAVPVTANESVIGVVRAADTGLTATDSALLWLALLSIAAAIVFGSALHARRAARQLAAPVEQLADAARAMGAGHLAIAPRSSGIEELDAAHAALVNAGARIADLVEREHRIASDASHQLRTPLAGLRAGIEVGLADPNADREVLLADALVQVDRMNETIDGLIALARNSVADVGTCDPTAVVRERAAFWRRRLVANHRRLELSVEDAVPRVAAPAFALSTVLDVLLENSELHGAGAVGLVVRTSSGVVAIDVIDSGPYLGPGDPFSDHVSGRGGSGLGLGLARRTTAQFGGRLLLAETDPHTRFGLLLPAAPPRPEENIRSAPGFHPVPTVRVDPRRRPPRSSR